MHDIFDKPVKTAISRWLGKKQHMGLALGSMALLGLAIVCFSGMYNTVKCAEVSKQSPLLLGDGLRGVYYGTAKQDTASARVGRLAIELLTGSTSTTVRVDHSFRTGDKIRFNVSSNQDGWLYILHRSASADEELLLLWPRPAPDNTNEYLDMNWIKAGRTNTIPSSPGLFIFDEEIGTEHFYVVVAAEKKTPQLTAHGASKSKIVATTNAAGGSKRIINFGVRSSTSPTAKPLRGELYDPGREDDDPFLYFATPADDDGQLTFVEFQLKHQE